ncbi:hypothetical protein J4410_03735 [Candidatus Woesearchaeota archaeon]|nr:hypothetical protein [Candidatus Woesearchaeota archaeon]
MSKKMSFQLGEKALPLENIVLLGWQNRIYDRILASMRRGIQAGDTFPAVPVCQLDRRTYILIPMYPSPDVNNITDGGHHRARSHLLEGRKLLVTVYGLSDWRRAIKEIESEQDTRGVPYRIKLVEEVPIVSDDGYYKMLLRQDKNYLRNALPEELAKFKID